MTYPSAITTWTYQNNQPNPPDLGSAENLNNLHSEFGNIEGTFGVTPFAGTPYTTLNAALIDLYFHKSPLVHVHQHEDAVNKNVGDTQHSLYAPVDGSIPYTGVIGGVAGTLSNDLVTLGQAQGQGFITTEPSVPTAPVNGVRGFVTDDSGYANTGPAVAPVGSFYGWKVTGALAGGVTNSSGILYVNIPPGMFNNRIQSLKITKIPAPGAFANPYTWQTDSLVVLSITPQNFAVRLTPGPASDHVLSKYIYFSWFAMGS